MNQISFFEYGKKIAKDYSSYNTSDADALAYITAASLTNSDAINSTHHIFCQLKKWGLYGKIQAMYLFKGANASAHKFNALNPIDTNAAFRIVFTGAATFSDLGYQLNGSSYGNSNFSPSSVQNVNSQGITISCGTNNATATTNIYDLGCFNSSSQGSILCLKNNNTSFIRRASLNNFDGVFQTGVNESRGVFSVIRNNASLKAFRNKINFHSTNTASGTLPTIPIWIGALNKNGVVEAGTYSTQRLQIVAFHEGLSDSEIIDLHSIIDVSETMAGRKTW